MEIVRKDCFAYAKDGCKALKIRDCERCGFYKPKGTECDTCHHKGHDSCQRCRVGWK